ncbi:MAG: IS1380 family transposase [Terrimicrobiaceae bacterium]
MTECKQEVFEFQVHGSRKVTGDFSGGYLSSDGGAVFLRGVDLKMGLIERLGGCFSDYRLPCLVEHKVTELLRQRIGALALGYEDLNDHDRLRLDPLHALIAGKADVLGEDRLCEGDKGKALAAHSTLNRLELGALGGDTRYKKIIAKPQEIEALLIEEGVKAIPRKSREIILDFDATDDPLHGNQEGAFFHGYYRNYCYLPLYCFCGNIPLLAQLRDAKRDASSGTVEALRKITCAIRKRFGRKVRIIVRADSGFAREEIMAWCEDNGVYYCLGLARNKRLSARLGKCFGELHRGIQSGEIQVPCRRFEDFEYRTRKSWSRARRVVGKAEILDKGQNPRFVVTNLPAQGAPRTGRALAAWRPAEGLPGEPQERFAARALYEKLYCARGEMENRIKEAQQDLFADRTSTSWMASNQLRLWFSAFAHLMVSVLRAEVLRGTDLASATLGQIRLKLFKIGARIKISCRRIHLELASAYPYQETFRRACANLCAMPAG